MGGPRNRSNSRFWYASTRSLTKGWGAWLKYYNEERPHQSYRTLGKRPAETIEEGKKRVPKKGPKKAMKKAA